MWVRWDSFFDGEMKTGKWHIRIDDRLTICGRSFDVLASIPMEDEGSMAQTSMPSDKKKICSHCAAKLPKMKEEPTSAPAV